MTQIAHERIEDDHRACMTNMAIIIDGHPADIELYFTRLDRHEVFNGSTQGIVYAKWMTHDCLFLIELPGRVSTQTPFVHG